MKNTTKYSLILGSLLFVLSPSIYAQDCVQCNGSTITGTNASAAGSGNLASGNNSFAGGYNSKAKGSNSFAFGYNSNATQSTTAAIGNTAEASGVGSMALGNYVKATAKNAIAIGCGTTSSYPLTNSTQYSIAFGVNSNKPTMLITKSINNNYTGKVAIGQVTSPTAKLHIKSDVNEDASVYLEPGDVNSRKAQIRLFDSEHSITVYPSLAMELNAKTGPLNFMGDHYCFGKTSEKRARLYSDSKPSFYLNVIRDSNVETREKAGTSYAIDFEDDAIRFRTASSQSNAGAEITNWKNNLLLFTDGKIGIGSKYTYLENNSDKKLVINSPQIMDVKAQSISLSGKIGINTTNDTDGYSLAVDGGIISTKVYIKEVNQWPDHVFSDDYPLLDIHELDQYLIENKHLPGLPPESEVLKNGYDIHEMQYLMMEKIEEMTRYIVQLQKEIDSILFTYDANGNRISRSLIFQKIHNPGIDPQAIDDSRYNLFPNPTPGQFSLALSQMPKAKLHAKLLNMTGVVLDEKDIVCMTTTFDLSTQPAGIYVLEIESPDERQAWKVIKNQ